jgi:hypothetical protein
LYLQNRLIQTGQTGGQLYIDTSPFSVPCIDGWFGEQMMDRQIRQDICHLPRSNT